MVRIERIICPIDLDDESLHALEQAVAMARRYRSALSAVHVVPKYVPPTPGITPVLAGPHPSAALINPDTTEPLKRQLEDFAAAARTEGIDARIELLEGDVVE